MRLVTRIAAFVLLFHYAGAYAAEAKVKMTGVYSDMTYNQVTCPVFSDQ